MGPIKLSPECSKNSAHTVCTLNGISKVVRQIDFTLSYPLGGNYQLNKVMRSFIHKNCRSFQKIFCRININPEP